MLDDAWRQQMIREVGIEASNYDSIKVVIKDADNDNDRQIEQIRNYKSDSHRYAVFHSSDNAHIPSVSAGFHFENEEPGKDAVGSPWIWWKNPC